MATKTISLEIDIYEKLRSAKKPGETFSSLVSRLISGREEVKGVTGAELLARMAEGGSGMTEEDWDAIEEASRNDAPPDDPWA